MTTTPELSERAVLPAPEAKDIALASAATSAAVETPPSRAELKPPEHAAAGENPPIQAPVVQEPIIAPSPKPADANAPKFDATKADMDAVMPPENPVTTLPLPSVPPTIGTPQGVVTASMIVMPNVLKKAEENLASFVGGKIDAALTQGLVLTLSSAPVKGATDVKISLEGPLVGANASLLGQEVVSALSHVPQLAPYFHGAHKPHAQKPDGKPNTVDIHIPQLTTAQYASLIQSFAAGINTQPTGIFTDEQTALIVGAAAGAAASTSRSTPPAIAQLETAPSLDQPIGEKAPVLSAAPQLTVVAPVAHQGVAANEPEKTSAIGA